MLIPGQEACQEAKLHWLREVLSSLFQLWWLGNFKQLKQIPIKGHLRALFFLNSKVVVDFIGAISMQYDFLNED